MIKESKEEIGSRTAKTGFQNEDKILEMFKNYKNDPISQKWIRYISERDRYISERDKFE